MGELLKMHTAMTGRWESLETKLAAG